MVAGRTGAVLVVGLTWALSEGTLMVTGRTGARGTLLVARGAIAPLISGGTVALRVLLVAREREALAERTLLVAGRAGALTEWTRLVAGRK